MNIKLTKQQRIRVKSPQKIAYIMRQILLRDNEVGRAREHFWVVGLDAASYLQYVELISIGSTNRVVVEPVEVFKWAIQKGVDTIIIVHNHSSYSVKPSPRDKTTTERLIQVGKFIGIPVADHIIINPKNNRYISFDETGLLQRLSVRDMYIPSQERLEMKKLMGKQEAIIEMVKILSRKKVSVSVIKEVAGITEKQVKELQKKIKLLEKSGGK